MLAFRHLRLGFCGLLLFLSLGLVLEALHGFKVGLYLDVSNEARRLAWRLSHAHGTLLSLVHVAFGLTLTSRHAPNARTAERASRLLTAATVLLPGGFLLGGLFIHGGDPGVGVLLVPLGGLALFGAIALTALGLRRETLELRELTFGSTDYDASFVLRSRVLREPLGLRPAFEERQDESGLTHLGAFEGTRLLACLMLQDLGDGQVRMRQVAVDFERQKSGLGTRLVRFSEQIAQNKGFREMVMHARVSAIPFYEQLGYECYGEPFIEVSIPHRHMKRALQASLSPLADRPDGDRL